MEALAAEIKKLQLEDYFLIKISDNVEKLKILYKELINSNNDLILDKKRLVDEKFKNCLNKGIYDFILENCTNLILGNRRHINAVSSDGDVELSKNFTLKCVQQLLGNLLGGFPEASWPPGPGSET